MNFDSALEAIQHGQFVKREDWDDELVLGLEDIAAEDWVVVEEEED